MEGGALVGVRHAGEYDVVPFECAVGGGERGVRLGGSGGSGLGERGAGGVLHGDEDGLPQARGAGLAGQ